MDSSVALLGCFALLLVYGQAAPVDKCPGAGPYSTTQDDGDCRIFYQCIDKEWIKKSCAAGRVYHPEWLNCVEESMYNCPHSTTTTGCTATSCKNGGACTKSKTSDGGAKCTCATGWTGDTCDTKDTTDEGTSPIEATCKPACINDGICLEKDGKATCFCPPGYGGETCAQSTKTTGCTATSCKNGGECTPTEDGGAKCTCATGWTGDICDTKETGDEGTSPIATCKPACENDGRCFEKNGEARCFCPEGYGGETCGTLLDPCSIITCENEGVCKSEKGHGKCTCQERYSGDRCQLEVSPTCAALQCQNNAQCISEDLDIKCDCTEGFTGDKCQYVDVCPQITCLNKGECYTDPDGVAQCKCTAGYTGSFCEIFLNCDGFTCKNGGQCIIEGNQRKCKCPERTKGEKCEKRLSCEGPSSPCHENSTCVNSDNGFICICPFGRTGQYCTELQSCSDAVCENDAKCENHEERGATCECKGGFQGPRCEIKSDSCGGCQNGGKCHIPRLNGNELLNESLCGCPKDYSGDHCEIKTETTPCPVNAGTGQHSLMFVYPDVENKEWVYLCDKGLLTHVKYCTTDGLWYDPFALECHNEDSMRAARDILYPNSIPE